MARSRLAKATSSKFKIQVGSRPLLRKALAKLV